MASFRILGLVSKNEIRSREFSFSSRSLRVKMINLDLVSMPEIGGNFFLVSSRSMRVSVRNSRSRLDERDCFGETLILVLRLKKRLSLTTGVHEEGGEPVIKITLYVALERFLSAYTLKDSKKKIIKNRDQGPHSWQCNDTGRRRRLAPL